MTNEELLIKLNIIKLPSKPIFLKNVAILYLTRKIKCQICKKFFWPVRISFEYKQYFWSFNPKTNTNYFNKNTVYAKKDIVISAQSEYKYYKSCQHFYYRKIPNNHIKKINNMINEDLK